jgi:glutaredoxin 3
VLENPKNLDRMLELSDGRRRVPVIVDGDQVAVGFNGRS